MAHPPLREPQTLPEPHTSKSVPLAPASRSPPPPPPPPAARTPATWSTLSHRRTPPSPRPRPGPSPSAPAPKSAGTTPAPAAAARNTSNAAAKTGGRQSSSHELSPSGEQPISSIGRIRPIRPKSNQNTQSRQQRPPPQRWLPHSAVSRQPPSSTTPRSGSASVFSKALPHSGPDGSGRPQWPSKHRRR